MKQRKKVCVKCKHKQPLSEFGADRRKIDGKKSHCKTCCRDYQSEYQKTVNGKAASARYKRTVKGLAVVAKSVKKYKSSRLGRVTKALYRQDRREHPWRYIA